MRSSPQKPPLILFFTMLACGLISAIVRGQDPSAAENKFRSALREERYELARKIAIQQFRPDWHCESHVRQAGKLLERAESLIAAQEQRPASDSAQIGEARKQMEQVRALGRQALATAENYVDAGWDAQLLPAVHKLHDLELAGLEAAIKRLDALENRAKPLEVLITQPQISRDEILKLDLHQQLLLGFHLMDRGLFDQAREDCFSSLRLDADPVIKDVASLAVELIEKWHAPATDRNKWDGLVKSGLDRYDLLIQKKPDQPQLASAMLLIVSHLARDHYDVIPQTIEEVLKILDGFKLPDSPALPDKLLVAKLQHEHFLVRRRAGQWEAPVPPPESIELFHSAHTFWYEAEASLIQAAMPGQPKAAELLEQAKNLVIQIRQTNAPLADSLDRRIQRYLATRSDFDAWLQMANDRDYQDRRGAVLPEVMVETRPQHMQRVRQGYEASIAQLIAEQQIEPAFQQAQKAKALTVGRLVEPLSVSGLISSKLMSQGVGGQMQIPTQELFLEYFLGPHQGWVFYLFAAGDHYEPMQVIELDPKKMASQCLDLVQALQEGKPSSDPGEWLLGGQPTLGDLWNRLEKIKKDNPNLRRIVVAPDGPLCYVPFHLKSLEMVSSVQYIPTAAVLGRAGLLDAIDVELLWEAQRAGFSEHPPIVQMKTGQPSITLWPKVTLDIHLKDVAE